MNKYNIENAASEIKIIKPDYEGVAKVLAEFEKLYKVCENKQVLDKCLENFWSNWKV